MGETGPQSETVVPGGGQLRRDLAQAAADVEQGGAALGVEIAHQLGDRTQHQFGPRFGQGANDEYRVGAGAQPCAQLGRRRHRLGQRPVAEQRAGLAQNRETVLVQFQDAGWLLAVQAVRDVDQFLLQSRHGRVQTVADQNQQVGPVTGLTEAGDHPAAVLINAQAAGHRLAVQVVDDTAEASGQLQCRPAVLEIAEQAVEQRHSGRLQQLGGAAQGLPPGRTLPAQARFGGIGSDTDQRLFEAGPGLGAPQRIGGRAAIAHWR